MQLVPATVAYAVFLGRALCVPTEAGSEPAARDTYPPGIQMWSGADFTGHYVHYTAPAIAFDTCYIITAQFPPGTPDGLNSVAADHKNFCTLYPNTVCDPGDGSDNDRLWVEGSYYDLGGAEEGWGDRAASFSCSLCTTCGN